MSSPAQLFSCVDAVNILRSPINDSTAKNHWSFAKDNRFRRPKSYCDSFYQIPGIKQNKNRMAGFGYGKKTDLDVGKDPHNIAPSPDTYDLASFVKTNQDHHVGFTPLFSREEIAPMSYIDLQKVKMPGAGTYNQYRYNQSPKWSMRPKTSQDIFPKTSVVINPAPCTYQNTEAIGANLTGKYHTGKHPNSKSKVFNPPRSARFRSSSTFAPGPGRYQPKNNLSNQGIYVLSGVKSSGKRTFMDGRRQSFTDLTAKRSTTPGPGSYRNPSDFGHYDSSKERYARLSKSQMIKGAASKMGDGSETTGITEGK